MNKQLEQQIKKELQLELPKFIEAVEMAQNYQVDCVMTTIHAFNSPEQLEKALRYALAVNVPVVFATKSQSGLMSITRRRAE